MSDSTNIPSCFDRAVDAAKRGGKTGVVMVGTPGVMVGAVIAGPPGIFLGGGLGAIIGGAGGAALGGGSTLVACHLSDVVAQWLPAGPTNVATRTR